MSLSENFKNLELKQTSARLTYKIPVIVRLDGRSFTSFTNKMGFKKPYCDVFNRIMNNITMYLCENSHQCVYATRHSDEISLLFIDYNNENTDAFFAYKIQKMVSVLAGMASACLVKELIQEKYDLENDVPHFDARAFNVGRGMVVPYFIYRKRDAEKNNISGWARKYYSHKQVNGLNSKDKISLLFDEQGINWEDVPNECKYGFHFFKVEKEISSTYNDKVQYTIRKKWVFEPLPDLIPDFVKDLVDI